MSRIFVTPLARKMALSHEIDLSAVKGSGPKGRIVKADIEHYLQTAKTKPAVATKTVQVGSSEVVQLTTMRKIIADRLTESKQTVPHFYVSGSVDMTAMLKLKDDLNAVAKKDEKGVPQYKITVNDVIFKAYAMAIYKTPLANRTWHKDHMLQYSSVDMGLAVAIEEGLVVPVVRQIQSLGIIELSNQIKTLVAKARSRKLLPEDFAGGSASVSNMGMFQSVDNFNAVINPPQASILAVGKTTDTVVVEKGQMVIRPIMRYTISADHRVIDGAVIAQLSDSFKLMMENPALMLS